MLYIIYRNKLSSTITSIIFSGPISRTYIQDLYTGPIFRPFSGLPPDPENKPEKGYFQDIFRTSRQTPENKPEKGYFQTYFQGGSENRVW
jgi:hypothetical protein